MQKTTPKLTLLLTAAAFYAFFVFGFSDNLKGPTLPAVLDELDLSYSLGGTILFGAYVGFLIATLLTGLLSDQAGKKAPLILAGVCLSIGVFGYSSSNSALTLTATILIIGLGLGSIELGANAMIVDLHAKRRGLYLNLMAVFHGVGSMIAPLYAGWLLSQEMSWRNVYRWDLILAGILLVIFLSLPYPRQKVAKQTTNRRTTGTWRNAFTPEMGWFYFALAIYVSAELGIASWVVEFLQKQNGQSVAISTGILSMFFLMITVGRLVGGFFVEHVGYLRAVLITSLGAAVSTALGIFGPAKFAIFIPLSGIFLSIIFPTITAEVTERHQENMGVILGILFALAGIGGMFGPWLIGVLADGLDSLQLGFGINVLYCLLLSAAVTILIRFYPRPIT